MEKLLLLERERDTKRYKASTEQSDSIIRLYDLEENGGGKLIATLYGLELPWKDNKTNISCIPEGIYKVVPRESKKFDKHFHILDVPFRKWILFHPANDVSELRGCIAPGIRRVELDGDPDVELGNSRDAMEVIMEWAPEGFELEII